MPFRFGYMDLMDNDGRLSRPRNICIGTKDRCTLSDERFKANLPVLSLSEGAPRKESEIAPFSDETEAP